jgi:hypothetical protein
VLSDCANWSSFARCAPVIRTPVLFVCFIITSVFCQKTICLTGTIVPQRMRHCNKELQKFLFLFLKFANKNIHLSIVKFHLLQLLQ